MDPPFAPMRASEEMYARFERERRQWPLVYRYRTPNRIDARIKVLCLPKTRLFGNAAQKERDANEITLLMLKKLMIQPVAEIPTPAMARALTFARFAYDVDSAMAETREERQRARESEVAHLMTIDAWFNRSQTNKRIGPE